MRTATGTVVLAMAIVLVSWAAPTHASPQTQPTADLTGTWVLNTELSDKPAASPSHNGTAGEHGGRGRSGGHAGGMGGFGGGMGGRGGSTGGPGEGGTPNHEDMERQRAVMDAALHVPSRLILVKSNTGFVVTDEEGVSVRIPLDGTKDTGANNGVPFETTAKWEEGKLRVERKFKGGLKLAEQYALSADGHQLTVTSKVEGGRMPEGSRTKQRTYDRRESF